MMRFAEPRGMLYRIKPEQVSLAKRITRSSLVFAITLFGAFLIHRLWFPQSASGVGDKLFDAVVPAGTFFVFDSQRREYEIEVTDETISTRTGWLLGNRRVRRGHLHSLRELRGSIFREPALQLSEHGAIGRFFFGYVWIAASMPQYQDIKSKALTWMKVG
jgi:hypothetical protein